MAYEHEDISNAWVIDKVSPFTCDNLEHQGQQKQKFDRKSCLLK